MLEIQLNMNSPVEEVLAFKTCCGLKMGDQNLEILVTNRGTRTVVVKSFFDLEGEGGSTRFRCLVPSAEQSLEPGEIKAFYCQMDETMWERARRLILHDKEGGRHPVDIPSS